jgi:PAS domain S-box-containing protein
LWRATFESALDAILLADDTGRYVEANRAACALFGLPREALLGRRIREFAAPDFTPPLEWEAFIQCGSLRGEFPLLRPDGELRVLDYSAVANVMPGLHVSFLRDVTERRRTEQALGRAEQQLRTVVSTVPIVLFAFDTEGIVTLQEGKGGLSMAAWTDDRVGQSVFDFSKGRPRAEACIRTALAGQVAHWEGRSQGSWMEVTLAPICDGTGSVSGVTGLALNVDARKHAEAALRASEARFRRMIEQSSEAIWLLDAKGTVTYATASIKRLLGAEAAEVVGTSVLEWIAPEDRQSVADELAQVNADTASRVLEFRILHRDGSVRWIETTGTNMLDEPAVGALVGNSRDITERKVAEQALRESRGLLQLAQSIAQLGSWSSGFELTDPVCWSRECYELFGVEADRPLTVEQTQQLVHPDDRARLRRTALAAESDYEVEYRIVHGDGAVRWMHQRVRIARDATGARIGLSGILQDVSARRRSESELRVSEERYRNIVETTSEGVWLVDGASLTTFVNGPMAAMLGYTPEEMVGRPLLSFMDAEWSAIAREKLASPQRSGAQTHEHLLRKKDGSELWVLSKTTPIRGEKGEPAGSLALVTDFTQRRREESARGHLAAIVESSDDAIFATDLSGIVTTWNGSAERLYGYQAAEIVGKSVSILAQGHPKQDESVLERLAQDGTSAYAQRARRHKNGSLVDVALTVSPIRNEFGQIIGVSKIARDLTKQRKADALLRRTEDQLRHAQKMEAVGRLAGGVAHDFNNLLSVIMGFSGLMLDDLKSGDPLRADVEQIDEAARKGGRLTKQLLAFSRQQILEPQVVDLNASVLGLERILRRVLGEDIELVLPTAASVGQVYADPGQIEQVIMNLVVNARDAMPDGGLLTIETSAVVLDELEASQDDGLTPGRYVMLAVTDTGTGMDGATAARVFEPFFTTKDQDKGTGLGLSTVFGIVKQSGGHVWLATEQGVGTTLKLLLPLNEQHAATSIPARATTSTLRGSETVLLVEDDTALRGAVRTILRRQGYTVLEASNGGEALLICEQRQATIHLLLTDVVMPRMNGRQLAERLAPLRPEMKVIFMSGYTEDVVLHRGVLDTSVAYIAKPITPDALARKLREVLDVSA